jgi:hypothetical protein
VRHFARRPIASGRRSLLGTAGKPNDAGTVGRGVAMKLVTEYLERVADFERMAAEATDPALKASLQKQADDYFKIAVERAKKTGQAVPLRPQISI